MKSLIVQADLDTDVLHVKGASGHGPGGIGGSKRI